MNTPRLRQRWLVVDDDAPLLKLTAELLRSLPGSEVISCTDPRAALEVFFAEPETFELIVTDFDMPELNGGELARRIHAHSPNLKVLLISGSGLDTATAQQAGFQAVLAKPYSVRTLLATVQALLAAH